MKLVGATAAFIRKPFIVNNIYSGVLAGILADAILLGMISYFNKEYVAIKPIISIIDLSIIFSIIILMGIIISTVATMFAVNRYVRMKTDHLYYV